MNLRSNAFWLGVFFLAVGCKDKPEAIVDAAVPVEVRLEGIDSSALTPRERREWSAAVSEFRAPCPSVPVSLAQCVSERRSCPKCLAAAKFLLKAVRMGKGRDQIDRLYRNRYDPAQVKDVPIDGSPTLGPETASVTVIEFADFECPYCGTMVGALDRVREAHKDRVRLVYKFRVFPSHLHSEAACRAAISAHFEGKFWEMHHKLFSNQQALTQSDLELYAKAIGLDPSKLPGTMKDPRVGERLAKDRALGDLLKVNSTPTIYVNGREFDLGDDLESWVAEELGDAPATGVQDASEGG